MNRKIRVLLDDGTELHPEDAVIGRPAGFVQLTFPDRSMWIPDRRIMALEIEEEG